MREYADVKGDGCITQALAQLALAMLDVDPHGLDVMDRKLLDAVIHRREEETLVAEVVQVLDAPRGEEHLAQLLGGIGLRGLVEVDDVADLIAMLASPAGRSYHGACVSIDAGITAG